MPVEESMVVTVQGDLVPDATLKQKVPLMDDLVVASNEGWGLSLGLCGGGLNSLNTGTSGWGAPPSNANAAATGWGAPPGPGQAPGPPPPPQSSSSPPDSSPSANNNANQWALSTSPNRNASQNTNGQPNVSGSQMNNNPNNGNASVGPLPSVQNPGGNSMQMNNQNMGGLVGVGPPGVGPAGSLPSAGSSNPANSGGIIPNAPSSAGSSSWAQAAGKSLHSSGGSGNGGPSSVCPSQGVGTGSGSVGQGSSGSPTVPPCPTLPPGTPTSASSAVTSKQIEQLNSMREALFSHDGWGGQNVNQDSSWDIPGSPEPTHKDLGGGQMSAPAGTSVWKMNVNNGTDLWEATLRNGGAPPAAAAPAQNKAPWGHTPTTNIGGTWGEDDDTGGDQSNVWNSGQTGGQNSSGSGSGGGERGASGQGGNGSERGQGNMGGQNQGPQGGGVSVGGGGGGGSGWNSMGSGNNGPQQQQQQRDPNQGMWNSAPMKKETNEWGSSSSAGGRQDVGSRGHGGNPHNDSRGGGNNGGMGVSGGGSSGHDSNSGSGRGWDDGGGGMRNSGAMRNQELGGGGNPGSQGMWNKPQGPPGVQQGQQGPPPQQAGWGGIPQGHSVQGQGMGGIGGLGISQGMKDNSIQGMGGELRGVGGMGGGKGSGWGDDVSPPTQRRPVPNIPNYDDGTALWGNPLPGQGGQGGPHPQQQQQRGMPRMPNKMDDGPGGWGSQIGVGGGNQNNRNGWQAGPDGPGSDLGGQNVGGFGNGVRGGGTGWEDNNKGIGSWGGDNNMQGQGGNQGQGGGGASNWGKPKTPTNNPGTGWGDDGLVDTSNWGAPPKNSGSRYHNGSPNNMSNTTKDPYGLNKPNFRPLSLADMGYKKEDLEMALRTSNMHLSDAIDSLDGVSGRPPLDQGLWGSGGGGGPMGGQQQRRHLPPVDDFDLGLGGMGPGGQMGGMGPPPQQQQRGGNPGYGVPNPKGFGNGGNSLINNVGNPSLGSINPTLLQRILTQQPNNPNPPGRVQPNGGGSTQGGGGQYPFNKSVSVLVQQIQMAVQAGYLSNQILQHPLPPQSLVLLNSLLQQIKNYQMLSQAQQQMGNSNSPAALQLSVQITKTKQHIQNLHNQISAQQLHHAKQQQQQQHQQHHHLGGGGPGGNDFYKGPPGSGILGDSRGGGGGPGNTNNLMDPMLQNSFGSDFLMNNKEGGNGGGNGGGGPHQQSQSRLSQWTKIPSLEKEDVPGGDFSRAPGPQSGNGLKNNSGLMLGQNNDTWSSSVVPRGGDSGWPTDHSSSGGGNGDESGKSNSAANMNADSWQTDLVPEFEPGKPWKGTQIMKNVDDDPTLTPGSVVRSPLSLAVIKDATEIFAKNSSSSVASSMASDSLPLSLSSSSTWSYTPTSAGSSGISNSMAKLNSTRDLWDYGGGGLAGGNGGNGGSRPPPGLPGKKQGGGPTTTVPSSSGNLQNSSFRNTNTAGGGWGGNQSGGGGPGNSYLWLLLRNLTPQIDGSTLKTLCVQHGPLQKFHLYLNHGVALVRYSTREEAGKAQNALNNCVLGNTTILAETAGDNDVHGLLQGLNAANVNAQQSNNSGFSGGNSGREENPWGVLPESSPLWSNNPWGSGGMDAPDRATPSSLNSLLPDGLLGGESA